jgi:hypothetical protein
VNDLDSLAADMAGASRRARPAIRRELDTLGRAVRDDARQFAPGAHGGPALHYPKAITHEVDHTGLICDIGPEKGGQGSLGHLFEYGVESRGLPPQAHLGPALDRQSPNLDARMADVLRRSIW